MIAEVTTAALMRENEHLANSCVTDSMAAHGARRLCRTLLLGANLSCRQPVWGD
ncbi:MAG: hypothetical protein WAO67_09555 [Yoonia sp.]|nr:hypothetical protein [bacterium]